ncbi:type I polyketide synthase [Streptomyces sp. NBC_00091]|uniref:type I polyketide synthase n=1 Tax=Streptomyces sp. NBC_00091 TaxID=2975648 RepID=UPI0022585797|nr:type I polyketide synthase [Streptomyces sp. NBC_00091]MCX5381157.1 SDR family NAD(P)-dependent oxidoreductase [Streptomyces sp. NBC_00091]
MSAHDTNQDSTGNEARLREYLRRAMTELHETQARLREAEERGSEPIAIVGMACRFPGGVGSPEGLWDLVSSGVDAVSGFPGDRGWDVEGLFDPEPGVPGCSYVREGGFLHEAGEFDAGFFGISPREAVAMDPQQRLLLETSWEALERAGIPASALRGTKAGVFVGAMYHDYGTDRPAALDDAGGYGGTGTSGSVVSGRISFALGLEGPAVTVDTACSSSLVALHLAAQSLRTGECDVALAGGVTVMATPGTFVEFSQQRGLAADGRCKAFADAADGTGWAEGVGMLLVERLSDAVAKGHRVLAVVRGSAVNQDGASNGLTAPNGPSQQRVIRAALESAGLGVADVDVVEAHGTGTRLGDPIEAQALLATYGQRSVEQPLWLGSLKSNIGHAQAAAGVGGVIKMVKALEHGRLPKTLHVDAPSSQVDWEAGAVELLAEERDWPEVDRPRRAGVSSFGVSGTNAHVILEQAPEPVVEAVEAARELPVVPLVLTARSEAALKAQDARLRARQEQDPALRPLDVALSLVTGRSMLEHRRVALGPVTVEGVAAENGRVAWVFPGQGTQWVGMGAGLLESSPVFAARMRECADALAPFVDFDAVEVVREGRSLDRVDVVQPVTWAVMVSLAEVWRSLGVVPDAVVGHSQGEIAAAAVSGALSLEDAARVVALRAAVIGRELAGLGGMASLPLPLADVEERLKGWTGRLGVAAVNGPSSTVVAGDADAVAAFVAEAVAEGIRARQVPVDYASHSAHVERIEAELLEVLGPVTPRRATIPFHSTVTAEAVDTTTLDASYWYRNLRRPVRFEDTVKGLMAKGFGTFVESSAHPVLTMGIQETAEAAGAPVLTTGSLRRDEGGLQRLLTSAAELFVRGTDIDWASLFEGTGARPVDLPTYAFQRTHHWLPAGPAAAPAARPDGGEGSGLGYRVTWKSLRSDESAARLSGRWLIVLPDNPAGSASAELAREALTGRGATVETLVIDPVHADRSLLRAALAEAASRRETPQLSGILSLLALTEGEHPGHPGVPLGLAATLALTQAAADAGAGARLWAATRGAVAVSPAESPSPAAAQTWGFGRVAALELPSLWGGLVDLPAQPDARAYQRLATVLATPGADDQIAVRPSGTYGRRLVPAALAPAPGAAGPRGTVLLVGDLATVGGPLARRLLAAGADRVVLAAEAPALPDADALRAGLAGLADRVTLDARDLGDDAALRELLALHTPSAVYVAPPTPAPTALAETTMEGFAAAVTAKTGLAGRLDALLDGTELDAFVVFSSVAGVWGGAGQSGYAAGTAHLDALAEARRGRGLPAASVAWTPWQGALTGPAADRMRLAGLEFLDPERALDALDAVVGRRDTGIAVADVDWARFAAAYTAARPCALLDELPAVRALRAAEQAAAGAGQGGAARIAGALRGKQADEQRRELLRLVRSHVAAVLGHTSPDGITPDRAFRELGLNSVTAVELRNRLREATGLELAPSLVFDHPTSAAVARHLQELASGTEEEAEEASAAFAAAPAGGDAEPVAIVAMACRFPGGINTPDELWQLLRGGGDAISTFPTNRGWDLEGLYDPDPDAKGRTYVREGGFLHEAPDFDPEFFGISPREALAMDPQQRLLLETSWEALERAGFDPTVLRGSRTGVFVGTNGQHYMPLLQNGDEDFDGYLGTGNSASVMSGRLSYVFGLEGPAVTVDTACSASLVALHLAVQSLRRGECGLALVGGATVMSTPEMLVEFSRQRVMSPTGRSRAFAAGADGVALGEGAGMLLVERLSDARRHGHPVLAVIRGSAVNQDGASNGLTAPNGPSQQRVIRQALADAGLEPHEVSAVEAHGTGTELGDPIEAQAVLATYGEGRPEGDPLWLGSVKSNIGHTQAAAGVAGVIKMVLSLRGGTLPRTLHVDAPTPRVDWSSGAVSLLTDDLDWPQGDLPRRAAVSAFGISGTNAHVILEEAPAATAPGEESAPAPEAGTEWWEEVTVPLLLSARSDTALRAQAARLRAGLLEHPGLHPADAGYTLLTARSRFEQRAAVIGESREELLDALNALAQDRPHLAVLRGAAGPGDRIAFVFPGQGSQWPAMAEGLLDRSPAFRDSAAACDAALAPYLDWSVMDVLRQVPGAPSLGRVDVVQPVLFTMMVSLAAAWRSLGVHPSAVVGHSQGEIAAAYVSGGLSLDDAARIVALRSQAWLTLAGKGGMIAVSLAPGELRTRLARFGDRLSVAAVNSPGTAAVAGEPAALRELLDELTAEGVHARAIPGVDTAGHSAQVDALKDQLMEALAPVSPRSGEIPFYSTVTGGLLDTAALDCAYWYRNMREPVLFEEATRSLVADGHEVFLEPSPHPMLATSLQETVADTGARASVLGTLRRDKGGARWFGAALGMAHVSGVEIDADALFGTGSRRVELPTYPFQRERYWYNAPARRGDAASIGLHEAGHPLLGGGVELPESGSVVYTARVGADTHPWLADHALLGTVLLPGAALVDLALWAGRQSGCGHLDELILQAPVVLPDNGAVELRLLVTAAAEDGRRTLTVHSREAGAAPGSPWQRHAEAVVAPAADTPPAAPAPWPAPAARPAGRPAPDAFYEEFTARGYDYGPHFRGFRDGWREGTAVHAEVALPAQTREASAGFGLHPALLDAALQAMSLGAFFPDDGRARMPFAVRGVRLHAEGADRLRVSVTPAGADAVSLRCTDEEGRPVLDIAELLVRTVSDEQLAAAAGPAGSGKRNGSLYEVTWERQHTPAAPPVRRIAVVGEDHAKVLAALEGAGGHGDWYPDLPALLEAAAAGGAPDTVAVSFPHHPRPDAGAAHAVTHRALDLAQAWLDAGDRLAGTTLTLVTRGAVAAGPDEHVGDPATATLWGLIRSAQSEEPGRFALLDLDPAADTDGAALGAALASAEPQLAVRGAAVRAPRLARPGDGTGHGDAAGRADLLVPPADTPAWRLATSGTGTLEGLRLAPAADTLAPLEEGQVRISVRAAGINFRDTLIALGMYPGDPVMGAEGAGVVTEVGPGVSGLAPGDRVLGMWTGGFGPHAVADHRMVAPVPAGWTYAQAASVPAVFLTAQYALTRLAKATPGQSLLIHAAAGGVGMAALQLARHHGLTVYATASTGKWDTLRGFGLADEALANSRTTAFAEEFLERTGGRGVDIVLNSLAGEFVDASLRLLPRGGHFLELGKADVRDPQTVAADHPGTRYQAFDLVQAGPETVGEMLRELLALFEAGILEPLPLTVHEIRHAREAFRTLSQARHTGKLVLTMPPSFGPHGTVLVTGGTGTLGSAVARHLVTGHGVRHLVLAGRQGPEADGAPELAAELSALGARVTVRACDAGEREQLAELLAAIPAEHPLTGIVHTAGVLSDGTLPTLTPEALDTVLHPKVDAVLNLHELTRDLDLSAFVLYSSSSALFGSPGQGGYAAANAFLDAFAGYRRSLGLPAVSLAWGLWSTNSRMAGHLDQSGMHRRLARGGVMPLTDSEGLALFDAAQAVDSPLQVPIRLNHAALRAAGPVPPFLSTLVGATDPQGGTGRQSGPAAETLADRLAGLPADEQEELILEAVRAHAAAVLGHGGPEGITVDRAFKELGFDSLTAVEMRNRLAAATGLRLAATLVFDHPTPAALAGHLRRALAPQDDTPPAPAAADARATSVMAELDRLEALFGALTGQAAATPDETAHKEIAGRLAALTGLWNGIGGTTGPSDPGDPVSVAESIEDADDDEIFAFIDERF